MKKEKGFHKGYDRFQSLLSQLKIHGARVSTEDANQKSPRCLVATWSLSSTASSSSTQNVAFVSSESTSNTNDVSIAYGVSTSFGHNSQREGSLSYTDELMYSFFANQSSGPPIEIHEDLEQQTMAPMLENADQKEIKKVEGEIQANLGIEQLTMVTSLTSKECKESYAKLKKLYDEQREQLGDASIEIQAYTQSLKKMSAKDKSGLGYGDQIHEGVLSYENEVLESVFDSRSSDVEDSHVYDRFAKVEGMHAVPPLMTVDLMASLNLDFANR
ncbi:hypothetical protein Tco_0424749 [Tanacetum coccineum]